MKIEAGIYEKPDRPQKKFGAGNTDGWKIVCEQEKVPHRLTGQPDCPVMVFDGETPDWLADFMTEGGISIVTDCNPDLLPFEVDYVADASIENVDLTELDGAVARVQCITRVYAGTGLGKIELHENRIRKLGIITDEFPVFVYQSYGKGGCWYTGLPMSKLLTVLGDTLRKSTTFSNYSERIVSVDKHLVARAMRSILIRAFHQRGLPYVHLGYYPDAYQSVFTFRIDIDGVYGENLVKVSQAAKRSGLALTLFANKSLCQKDAAEILKIDAMHEIGSHADIHNLYTDYASNLKNLQACQQWMDQVGIQYGPWFAAPRGMWNYALHQALEDLGYAYTSDFGVCIEGFPFFPYHNGTRSKPLQIPVNPFSAERASIWRAEEEGTDITPEFVADVFETIIENDYALGYPVMLYSHPEKFGRMADFVFERISRKLADLNIWKTTASEYAQWWKRRDQTVYSADYDPMTQVVTLSGELDADMQVKEL